MPDDFETANSTSTAPASGHAGTGFKVVSLTAQPAVVRPGTSAAVTAAVVWTVQVHCSFPLFRLAPSRASPCRRAAVDPTDLYGNGKPHFRPPKEKTNLPEPRLRLLNRLAFRFLT